jgi:GntR family transcriptional regulator, transcriptional repressor for pyruvate dehydrogenase complex
MPLQPIDPERLYRKIAQMISGLIESGEFAPGQKLPGERDLAQQLGVSRPSVREALIALEVEGKVEVRVGAGIFVCPPSTLPRTGQEPGEGPFELIRARWIVEGETAALAALQAQAADKAELRAAVDDLRRARSARQRENADRRLHLAIGRATHNGPLSEVVEQLWDQGRGALWKQMELHFQTAALTEQTVRDHEALVLAIESGSEARARKAMHEHLTRVHREFARGFREGQKGHAAPSAARATRRNGP